MFEGVKRSLGLCCPFEGCCFSRDAVHRLSNESEMLDEAAAVVGLYQELLHLLFARWSGPGSEFVGYSWVGGNAGRGNDVT